MTAAQHRQPDRVGVSLVAYPDSMFQSCVNYYQTAIAGERNRELGHVTLNPTNHKGASFHTKHRFIDLIYRAVVFFGVSPLCHQKMLNQNTAEELEKSTSCN